MQVRSQVGGWSCDSKRPLLKSLAGLTWFTPNEDQSLISSNTLKARISGALGGRAAEQIVFGNNQATCVVLRLVGSSEDILTRLPLLSCLR